MTLWFDVVNSPSLSQEQKGLVLRRLENRIGKDGVLRGISQQTRSQAENRQLAIAFCRTLARRAHAGPDKKEDAGEQGGEAAAAGGEEAAELMKNERSKRLPRGRLKIPTPAKKETRGSVDYKTHRINDQRFDVMPMYL